MLLLVAGGASPGTADQARAQDSDSEKCELNVEPVPGERGYKNRDANLRLCEGMYVALQSAPLNLQVISYVTDTALALPDEPDGEESSDAANTVRLRPRTPDSAASDSVLVVGRTRQANLNWALDAVLRPSERETGVAWNLRPVVWEDSLTDDQIGLYARTPVSTSPFDDPIFTPVEVRGSSGQPDEPPDYYELVVRIPGASAVKWEVNSDGSGESGQEESGPEGTGQALNADGFFRLLIPRSADEDPGVDELVVYWRPRGRPDFHPVPELLQIYRE